MEKFISIVLRPTFYLFEEKFLFEENKTNKHLECLGNFLSVQLTAGII